MGRRKGVCIAMRDRVHAARNQAGMLSLVELERAAAALSETLVGGRVARWLEPDPGRIVFQIRPRGDSAARASSDGAADRAGDIQDEKPKRKWIVDLDARPGMAHVALIDRFPAAPPRMPAFCAYLRAHLSSARLDAVFLRSRGSRSEKGAHEETDRRDRQLALRFETREGPFTLLLCLFGRRSNLYLLDAEDRLVVALRPLPETRTELSLGERYVDPGGEARKAGEDRFKDFTGPRLLDAIGRHYADEIRVDRADRERRELLAVLRKERRNAERRLAKIEAELAEAEAASALAREGELLKANLARVVPGADSIEVSDFETGEPVRIGLDPKLSAKQNLQAIFKRYQKLVRRLTKAGGQVETTRENLRALEALEAEIRGLDSGEDEAWEEVLAREPVRRILSRHAVRRPAADGAGRRNGKGGGATAGARREAAHQSTRPAIYRDRPRRLHPRRYRSVDGLEIWVGRSD
ncbi:MAG TPA: hypothetical protein ENI85_05275, partial [Deltaproteobacteria bacterium]|nr:hypothetical protein [Deltaproteobacteria bacterium]